MRTVWFVVLLAGCGDETCVPENTLPSDAPANAPDAAFDPACGGSACGGDVTGTWQLIAGCAGGEGQYAADCAGSAIRIDNWYARWTATFAAEGAITIENLNEVVTGRIYVPLDCVAFQDCDGLTEALRLNHTEAVCETVRDTCAAETAKPLACDCTGTQTLSAAQRMASFVITGPTTLELSWYGETIRGEYCVQNDQLWIHAKRFGTIDYYYRFQRFP